MSPSFTAPTDIRIRHYRGLAAELLRMAACAPSPELRASFLGLAASWGTLADQVERQADRADRIDQDDTNDNAPPAEHFNRR